MKQRNHSTDVVKTLENIISLFGENNGKLSPQELFPMMKNHFNFEKSFRTLENYIDRLEENNIEGVTLKKSKKNAGQHTLSDTRIHVLKEREEAHKKMLSKEQLIAEEHAYMRLALEAIKKLKNLSEKHHKIIENRFNLHALNTPYFIESERHEEIEIGDPNIVNLKKAIQKDYLTEFRFIGKGRKSHYIVEPYKLIIFDGVWYMFGKDTQEKDKSPYKTWRLIYIKDVRYDSNPKFKHTVTDENIEKTLSSALHPEFNVDVVGEEKELKIIHDIDIEIKVHATVSHTFDHHAHLPGAVGKPVHNADGSFNVCARVSSFASVDQEIKKWLPHIEVLAPEEYRIQFKKELSEYIKGLH